MDGAPGQDGSGASGVDALSTLVRILQHWRLLVLFPLATAVAVAVISLVLPAKYVASASFVPEESPTSSLPGSLAGLAAQFGVSANFGSARSPDFYANLLQSRSITAEILTSRYANSGAPGDSVELLDYLKVRGRNARDRLENGLRLMTHLLSVGVDRRTSIVHLSVELKSPVMVAAVANRYLAALNEFNVSVRESVGRKRREFVEGRLASARQDLHDAENALRRFYERNVRYQDSPQLVFEQARLQRAVTMAQDLYTAIDREYESARIAEVNDTPVITVLDSAVVPARRSFPRRTVMVVGGAGLAFLVSLVLGLIAVKREDLVRRHPEESARLRSELLALKADVASAVHRSRGRDPRAKDANRAP